MLLTEKHIRQFAGYYLICFLLNYVWYFYNRLTFSSLKPVFFVNRLDFTRNILFLTDMQHILMQHKWLFACFDIVYFILPLLLGYTILKNKKGRQITAGCTAAFSLVYSIYFSSTSYISIEVFVVWMMLPLLFCYSTVKGFYYNMHILRIIFIIIFFSSALWKITSGGIFNKEQMAGVLLFQHAAYLTSNNNSLITKSIYYLVQHQLLAYCLYLAVFIGEFSFAVGFFTRKYDRFLIFILTTFLFFDYTIMFINYFAWMAFMGCFYFSRYSIDKRN